MRRLKWLCVGCLALGCAAGLTACGDDEDEAAVGGTTTGGTNPGNTTVIVVTNETTVVTNAPAPQALVAPQLVTPADGMDNDVFYIPPAVGLDIDFEWTAVPGAASYVLEINGEQRTITGTTATVVLSYGNYTWRVWAKDANGASGPASATFSFNV